MPQLTRLGVSGVPRGLYGSFAGKGSGEHPVSRLTRLGVSGIPRQLYGSFDNKELVFPQITRLGLAGIPRGLYGPFSGKEETAAVIDEVVANLGGTAWLVSQAHRDLLLREDDELLAMIASLVTSGILDE